MSYGSSVYFQLEIGFETKKTIKMVFCELTGKPEIGLGRNGFYMVFRTIAYNKNVLPRQ